jgi:hypothetical protein
MLNGVGPSAARPGYYHVGEILIRRVERIGKEMSNQLQSAELAPSSAGSIGKSGILIGLKKWIAQR